MQPFGVLPFTSFSVRVGQVRLAGQVSQRPTTGSLSIPVQTLSGVLPLPWLDWFSGHFLASSYFVWINNALILQ